MRSPRPKAYLLSGPVPQISARLAALGALVALTGAVATSRAGVDSVPAAAAGGAPAVHCTRGERPALTELACELSRELGGLDGLGSIAVAAGPVTSDRPLKNGTELAERLTRRVAEALGSVAAKAKPASSLAEAQRAARRSKTLVFLAATVAGGELRATAEAEPTAIGFWDRLRGKTTEASRHAFASRPLDAEVASFLPQIPLLAGHVEKAANPTSDVVALACGDVDGDSSLEIAIVGRRRIQLGRIREHRFVAHAETTWAALEPIAPSPLREPLAAADVVPGRGLLVGSTDRASAVWLLPTLERRAELGAVLPIPGVGCVLRDAFALGLVIPCAAPGSPAGATLNGDAAAGATLVTKDGTFRRISAVRGIADGVVVLVDGAKSARVTGAGSALALSDLDLDGSPELVASVETTNPAADAVVVRTWDGSDTLRERYRLPVPSGVRALAVCPPEDAGTAPIVVATESSLWVLR